ncbi:TPA: mannose-6-phosphate isomerase [Legionella pneumophila]|uniref:Mannose-6-phosphate isomerase n=3 Tax=Gammaproteobacteria TaxID=1236 RepID=Q5ZSZ2_LEGPH|nr:mannose-6-phosphate isomerase [Legionella pneumophila]AAU28435.1 mannose-6-phosphate isomerase [Legionella pneumophila subsp. pneumophila str. Philadelphia 1]AEW52611.1 mannose-6-phosphate isomerase [Legionella pneumophila subsp. pneumophila ATCC 43290]AGH52794.1 Mannose-6-phosphate isomerase [Legionella pneumophila subsp. pneumophila LPE509]AGN15293.1 mannose-6-phosphate isomerase [Legionella pneumophila subsp. pneumophila str. Thunder Bay]AOU05371.1 cupin [Legionella pneumophila]
MQIIKSSLFNGDFPWQALDIAQISDASIRLHWADQPYIWHKNDGDEVFVVLSGKVIMHYREGGVENQKELNSGDICYLKEGCEHVAYPKGAARILVIEKIGSI